MKHVAVAIAPEHRPWKLQELMSKTGVVKNWNEDKGFGFIGREPIQNTSMLAFFFDNLISPSHQPKIWEAQMMVEKIYFATHPHCVVVRVWAKETRCVMSRNSTTARVRCAQWTSPSRAVAEEAAEAAAMTVMTADVMTVVMIVDVMTVVMIGETIVAWQQSLGISLAASIVKVVCNISLAMTSSIFVKVLPCFLPR